MEDNTSTSNPSIDDELIEERRKFVRLSIRTQVTYSASEAPDIQYTATAQNIAAGGICLALNRPLRRGDVLKLSILLPDYPPAIHTVGKVVWIEPANASAQQGTSYSAGVEFIAIRNAEREKIDKYIYSLKFR